jgi:hypothetical protein
MEMIELSECLLNHRSSVIASNEEEDVTNKVTYGISIDMTNTDPTSAVTYIDDAVDFTPLSVDLTTGVCDYGSWEDIITNIFGCKPCLWKDGSRTDYLNPNDYTLKADGTEADITSGDEGDVMVEFKKCWYKFSYIYTSSTDIRLTFEIANYNRSKDGFVTAAFKSEDGKASDVNYFYYGAYNGYMDSDSKLRSLSGKTPLYNVSFVNTITYATNLHTNCKIECFYKRT